MNPKPIEQARSPLLADALPALRRAATTRRSDCHREQHRAGYVFDGQIVRLHLRPPGNDDHGDRRN